MGLGVCNLFCKLCEVLLLGIKLKVEGGYESVYGKSLGKLNREKMGIVVNG
jgi:hypothetical protein